MKRRSNGNIASNRIYVKKEEENIMDDEKILFHPMLYLLFSLFIILDNGKSEFLKNFEIRWITIDWKMKFPI